MNTFLALCISALGWVGAAVVLVAYILVSRGTVSGDSLRYQALSMAGSMLLLANCAAIGAWPSAITNLVFLFVGINIVMTTKRAHLLKLIKAHLPVVHHKRRIEPTQNTAADFELVVGI